MHKTAGAIGCTVVTLVTDSVVPVVTSDLQWYRILLTAEKSLCTERKVCCLIYKTLDPGILSSEVYTSPAVVSCRLDYVTVISKIGPPSPTPLF